MGRTAVSSNGSTSLSSTTFKYYTKRSKKASKKSKKRSKKSKSKRSRRGGGGSGTGNEFSSRREEKASSLILQDICQQLEATSLKPSDESTLNSSSNFKLVPSSNVVTSAALVSVAVNKLKKKKSKKSSSSGGASSSSRKGSISKRTESKLCSLLANLSTRSLPEEESDDNKTPKEIAAELPQNNVDVIDAQEALSPAFIYSHRDNKKFLKKIRKKIHAQKRSNQRTLKNSHSCPSSFADMEEERSSK